MSFVVAEVSDDGKPQAFYQPTTPQSLELTEDLQQAFLFEDKPSARQAQSIFQREFNDKEIAVIEVTTQIKLV